MRKRILWITETAILLALLVLLQFVTKSAGQLLTGVCVNCVLAVAVLVAGPWSGVTIALLSSWFAFLLGIGPQLLPIVPAISLGNLVFVLLLFVFVKKMRAAFWTRILGLICAAAGKALALYLLIVQLLCRVLPVTEQQIAVFRVMFSWKQLVTALLGGLLGLILMPALQRAKRKS